MKRISVKPGSDLTEFTPCDVVASMRQLPIEDHPFVVGRPGQANVRFRQLGEQKKFQRMKAAGINFFLSPTWEILPFGSSKHQ